MLLNPNDDGRSEIEGIIFKCDACKEEFCVFDEEPECCPFCFCEDVTHVVTIK